MSQIYIALGANLSNQKTSFIKALERLEDYSARIIDVSGLWQSPSWPPGHGHPDYLNAAAEISFDGTPESLLELLQSIETEHGRQRTERNAPRTLDLDILDFQGRKQNSETLTLPHPRMCGRGFVLFPLQQIAPEWRDPVSANRLEAFIAKLPLNDVAPMKYRGKFWPRTVQI